MNRGYDHYKEAEELIALLREIQLNHVGDKLQTAIDSGATGTEIFMALRWHLKKLLDDEASTDIVRVKADRLCEELDKALR